MYKILLANLGNRNILYKGKTYPDFNQDLRDELGSFREWTKSIILNWEVKKEFIELNILDKIIAGNPNQFNKIVLFYSDQKGISSKIDQDTLHEAEIYKLILSENFVYVNIELVKIEGSVIDTEKLLSFYRDFFRKMRNKLLNPYYIISDSGGSAQQKQALKIIAEFLLSDNEYEVRYVNIIDGSVSPVHNREYRKIILFEQAINLISHGYFEASASLLGVDIAKVYLLDNKKYINEKLLGHIVFRFNNKYQEAKSSINDIRDKSFKEVAELKHLKTYAEYAELEKYLGVEKYRNAVDRLYKVKFLLNKSLFEDAILALSQFYEYLLDVSIAKLSFKDQFGKLRKPKTQEQIDNINQFLQNHYADFILRNTDYKGNLESISTQVMICQVLGKHGIEKFSKILAPHIYKTSTTSIDDNMIISSLRNKIAHEGMYIDKNLMENKYSYVFDLVEDFSKILKLTKKDMFQELAELLEFRMRQ